MRELSLHVMDIAQNSITAGATLTTIAITEDTGAGTLTIEVTDNGCGMSPEQLAQVQSPFFSTRKTRSIGMGIPLFKMACELTGGSFAVASTPGEGTVVTAILHPGHIDMVPLGNMTETVALLISCNPALDFIYIRRLDDKAFTLDTRWLRQELGEEVPLNDPNIVLWLRDHLDEGHGSLLA